MSFENASLLALHLLYAAAGTLLIRRLHDPLRPSDWHGVRRLAAYPIGLVPNLIVAFCANQFFGLVLEPLSLVAIAIALVILAFLLPRGAQIEAAPPPTRHERWSVVEGLLLFAVAAILARRHGFVAPLSDWDALMYHLPLAEVVRGGHFPDEIGRSYVRQYEAAFPPLLYFLYGLLPGAFAVVSVRVVTLVANAGLCLIASHVTHKVLGSSRGWGLVAAGATAALVNVEPNTQSITAVYFGLMLVFALDAFETPKAHRLAKQEPPSRRRLLPIVALLGAGCYWNSYLGAGLLAVIYPALALGALGRRWRGHRIAFDWKGWLGTGLATLLLIAPHLLRNTAVAGNPLYPALPELFGGVGFTDWFLPNRPPAGTSIEDPWRHIAASFERWRPIPHWIVAGAGASLLLNPPAPGRRAQLFLVLSGFFLLWVNLYHRHSTPLDRYLTPLLPIAAAAVTSLLSRAERHRNLRAVTWLLPIGAAFAPLLLPAEVSRGLPPRLFAFYLGAAALAGWILDRWMTRSAGAAGDEALPPGRTLLAGLELRPTPLLVSAVLCALGVLSGSSQWPSANQYRAPIAADIEWMNRELPEDARVLLFDGRILGLERDYLPIDDLRLEDFGRTKGPGAASRALRALGVTHFYFSYGAGHLMTPAFKRDLFVPRRGKRRVRLVHESETGWVVELR